MLFKKLAILLLLVVLSGCVEQSTEQSTSIFPPDSTEPIYTEIKGGGYIPVNPDIATLTQTLADARYIRISDSNDTARLLFEVIANPPVAFDLNDFLDSNNTWTGNQTFSGNSNLFVDNNVIVDGNVTASKFCFGSTCIENFNLSSFILDVDFNSSLNFILNLNDSVKDFHIDWGTDTNQVSALDLPIADENNLFDSTNTEGALQEVGVDVNSNNSFFNGTIDESFNAFVTSDGATITMSLTGQCSDTLLMNFDGKKFPLDVSSLTITLTGGSDSSPTENFVFIPISTKTLTKSTSSFPTEQHSKIGYFLVPSAGFVQTNGVYINQNWNDDKQDCTGQGDASHMSERSRRLGAKYFSGVAGNGTDGYFTPTANNVELISTSGIVYQKHAQTIPSFDTSDGNIVLVKNWSGDAFHDITNLFDITADSTGTNIGNNKYFNLVIWKVANKTTQFVPTMINLPSGFYNKQTDAENDVSGYDDFTMPFEFNNESSTGFLVARVTIKMGTTWVITKTVDLRGTNPQSASGSAAGILTNFADNQFSVFDESDVTKTLNFDVGTLVSTTTTITLQIPNANGIIALTSKIDGTLDLNSLFDVDTTGFKNKSRLCWSNANSQWVACDPEAETVVILAQAGEAIGDGNTVYASGQTNGTVIVSLADADDSNKMPVLGFASESAGIGDDVMIVTYGHLNTTDTSAFSVGDSIYASTTLGGFTNVKPIGTALVQKIAEVTNSNVLGHILIFGAGRTNDIPNIPEGSFWLGDSNGVPQAIDFNLFFNSNPYDSNTVTACVGDSNSVLNSVGDCVSIQDFHIQGAGGGDFVTSPVFNSSFPVDWDTNIFNRPYIPSESDIDANALDVFHITFPTSFDSNFNTSTQGSVDFNAIYKNVGSGGAGAFYEAGFNLVRRVVGDLNYFDVNDQNIIIANDLTTNTILYSATQNIADGNFVKTGDWTGTLDGFEASELLNDSNYSTAGGTFDSYAHSLFSGVLPISYNSGTGAFSFTAYIPTENDIDANALVVFLENVWNPDFNINWLDLFTGQNISLLNNDSGYSTGSHTVDTDSSCDNNVLCTLLSSTLDESFVTSTIFNASFPIDYDLNLTNKPFIPSTVEWDANYLVNVWNSDFNGNWLDLFTGQNISLLNNDSGYSTGSHTIDTNAFTGCSATEVLEGATGCTNIPNLTGTNFTGIPADSILAGTFGTGAYVFDNTLDVTGVLTIGDGTGDIDMTLNGAVENNRIFRYMTGGIRRFGHGLSASPETGSNVGSDWILNSFNDDGSFRAVAILVERATAEMKLGGALNIKNTTSVSGILDEDDLASDSATDLATQESIKAYVDSNRRIPWSEVTGTTQAGAVNNGYIANNASEVVITLPATCALGDIVRVIGKGAGGWKLVTNTGQAIHTITTSTARGAGFGIRSPSGLILGTDLICTTANADWTMLVREGNIVFTKFSEKSILFDGINEGLDITSLLTNVLTTTTQGTFSAWVKPVDATPSGNEYIISFGDTDASENLQIRFDTSGRINASVRIAATNQWRVITTGGAFSNNTWGHVALVHDGIEAVIYVNGVAVSQSFDVSVDKTKWFNDFGGLDNGRIAIISANNAGNNSFFRGNIDDVTFWDTNLTPTQISEIYNSGVPIDPLEHSQVASLVAYYKMGDSDGDDENTIIDASTNSNNATGINLEAGDLEEDTPPT